MIPCEVVIPSRGSVGPVLAGLLPHAAYRPFSIRLVLERWPSPADAAWGLTETLRHMGCDVVMEMQRGVGPGPARAQGAMSSHADILVYLDDDAVLTPSDALIRLVGWVVSGFPWATPIIRFVGGFHAPRPGHTEIWERVPENDPRVVAAVAANGRGWDRVFDHGSRYGSRRTDQLCGTCFATKRSNVVARAGALTTWRPGLGGSDAWLGAALGEGVVVERAYAYHYGNWSREKWAADAVLKNIEANAPDTLRKAATKWIP